MVAAYKDGHDGRFLRRENRAQHRRAYGGGGGGRGMGAKGGWLSPQQLTRIVPLVPCRSNARANATRQERTDSPE